MARVYTAKGDDGTTGLLFGGRVPKDDARPDAYGDVDECQAVIGLARAAAVGDERATEVGRILLEVERDLYVLMAELATDPANHDKLTEGSTRVTPALVERISATTDEVAERFPFPTEFVLPGQSELGARLDVARTVARRAERRAVTVAVDGSHCVPYLNRLSSLLWTLARWVESDRTILSKEHRP